MGQSLQVFLVFSLYDFIWVFFLLVFGHVICTCWLCFFFFFAWFSILNFDWLDQMQGRCWFWIGFFCGFMMVEVGVGFCYGSFVGSRWWWWWQVVFGFCLGGSRWVCCLVLGSQWVCCDGGFGVVVLLSVVVCLR